MAYKTEQIRNLTLIGSGAVGKTSLLDAFLFKTGVNSRLGKVEDGTSMSDYTPEDKEVGHSLSLKMFHLQHGGCEVHLLDTPGYGDYVGEPMAALAAVDAAVLVIPATGAIPAAARKLYEAAREYHLALFIVVNKLEVDQADFDTAVEHCRTLLGLECTPVMVPDASGPSFSKVTDLLGPEGASSDQRSALLESLVETDEAAMEKYLEEGDVSAEEAQRLFTQGVSRGDLVPILACSAAKDIGVGEVLDHVVRYSPSPVAAAGRSGRLGDEGEELQVKPGAVEGTCVQVFKTLTDPYVGKLSFLRVWSGDLSADSPLVLQRSGKPEKLANLLWVQGKEHEGVTAAIAGDVLAVAKVEHLETGDTLCSSADSITMAVPAAPTPMVSLAVEAKNRADEQKLSTGLRKLASEDLTFTAERDATTHELVISGVTNLHLDTMIKRLKERFGIEIQTKPPRVPLKETVQVPAEGHYRHKKQTGGAGQFGEVYLKVEPRERGEGFEFSDEVVGGSIPKNFLPAVEKGIVASMDSGVFAGYPVVDVKVRVYDGKHHPVDSNETSFKIAGARAFRDAFLKARPGLLEPIVDLVVEAPSSAMGDITGDLNSRRGRIQGIDPLGDLQIIKAQVPLREILTYSADLRSMTAGEGSYTYSFSHYDVLPNKLAEEMRSQFKVKDED